MKYVLNPSLEHMALVKIGITLWNKNDVRALISKLYGSPPYNINLHRIPEWEKIEERVVEKVSQLSLPELLKEKVFGVIKPIGIQILEWMQYNPGYDEWRGFQWGELKSCPDLELPALLPADLCWTPQGTLDRKKTVEILVKDENWDVSTRYILACDYCLEDDINRLWNRLPEDIKDYDWRNYPLIWFWSDNMKSKRGSLTSYKDVFFLSAFFSNKVATEYFLQKLTPQEKEEALVKAAKYARNADVLCLLLSELSEEKQMEVFKSAFSKSVLIRFLQWPWQSFFVGVANSMWDHISKNEYWDILRNIIFKISNGYKDCNYQKLFGEFWQKSPNSLKSFIINEIATKSLLPYLFSVKDKEIIRIILKDTNLIAKEKLIYSADIKRCFRNFVRANQWDYLEFCIQEFSPSKNEMLKLKEEFEKHRMSHSFKQNFATKIHICDIFCLPDESLCKYDVKEV